MKKLCTILLAVSLILALAACGGGAPAGADAAAYLVTTKKGAIRSMPTEEQMQALL